ncbi:MAG: hypothetical protein EA344_08795 [Alkalicoccus sp.]|nr:MAG: hypothetical protein EA344_08795 [Alkalicoccus sp.]
MEHYPAQREIYVKGNRYFAVEIWEEDDGFHAYAVELAEETSRGVFRRGEKKEEACEKAVETLYKYNF